MDFMALLPELAVKLETFAERLASDPAADHNAIATEMIAPHAASLAAASPLLKRILGALLRAALAALGE